MHRGCCKQCVRIAEVRGQVEIRGLGAEGMGRGRYRWTVVLFLQSRCFGSRKAERGGGLGVEGLGVIREGRGVWREGWFGMLLVFHRGCTEGV